MVSKIKFTLLIAFILFATNSFAQSKKKKRLQPGKRYEAGQKIYAPKVGFESTIPQGWEGTLPRESEIFSLMPTTPIGGQLFAFSSIGTDLKTLRESWMKGVNLSESILIKAKEEAVINGDMISAEVIPAGQSVNTGNAGYVIARCGPFGQCITCLGIGPKQFLEQVKTAVTGFMSNAAFSQPADISIYVDFDWKEFLKGKMLISYAALESGSKENIVDLCSDGTFTAKFDKQGIFKNENSYKGKQTGTWEASGVGDKGTLKLKFKKLPEAEISLFIKDEKITANGERYFAGQSEKCE